MVAIQHATFQSYSYTDTKTEVRSRPEPFKKVSSFLFPHSHHDEERAPLRICPAAQVPHTLVLPPGPNVTLPPHPTLSPCSHEDLCPWCTLRLVNSFRAWLCLSLFSTASYPHWGQRHLCRFGFPVTRTDDKLNREGYKYFLCPKCLNHSAVHFFYPPY